jgi:hypothetical protein
MNQCMRYFVSFLIMIAPFAMLPAVGQQSSGLVLMPPPLTNENVIDLRRAGFDEPFILEWVRRSRTNFDVSTKGLVSLRTEGISEDLIRLMTDAPAKYPAAPAGSETSPKVRLVKKYYFGFVRFRFDS